jgi:hypothetical protein
MVPAGHLKTVFFSAPLALKKFTKKACALIVFCMFVGEK